MSNNIEHNETYEAAVSLVVGSGDEIWQTVSAFLLTHSIFMGFLLSTALGSEIFVWRPGAFIASIIGISLCFIWAALFSRNIEYYRFRIAQAREYEHKTQDLLGGRGQRFAEGDQVTVGGESHQIPCMGRCMRASGAIRSLIVVFLMGYIVVLVFTGWWWR